MGFLDVVGSIAKGVGEAMFDAAASSNARMSRDQNLSEEKRQELREKAEGYRAARDEIRNMNK